MSAAGCRCRLLSRCTRRSVCAVVSPRRGRHLPTPGGGPGPWQRPGAVGHHGPHDEMAILIAACAAVCVWLRVRKIEGRRPRPRDAAGAPGGAGLGFPGDCGLADLARDASPVPPGPGGSRATAGWGLLLSAVLGVMVVLLTPWYGLHWTVATAAALVVGLLVLAPRAVADVASAGLILQKLLLREDTALTGPVEQLTQTRAEAVASAAAELRRVERDLHDGAQARLVALGLSPRAAGRMGGTPPRAARALLAEAT